jgi:hypothetical protein
MTNLLDTPIEKRPDVAFDPAILARDLNEVRNIYARLFTSVDPDRWNRPSRGGGKEWTRLEAIAHLCALNGAGLDCITQTLKGLTYTFVGLETRCQLNEWNRKGIDEQLVMSADELCAEFLRIHETAYDIACTLKPEQAEMTAQMPIYNRPIQLAEALSIIIMHACLIHSAQVAEPPLWMQLSPEARHRMVGRVMRAFSLLYRHDIGGLLRARLVFRIEGPDGGEWSVDMAPEAVTSSEGPAESATLAVSFREVGDFCRMLTRRLNVPLALVLRRIKLQGDMRLFLRMSKLFSPDARP